MKNKPEHGRSMLEMLAVLALIGILSVGGLSAYDYASASYEAGQIRDALLTAKKSASMNTALSHEKEVQRLLKDHLFKYGLTSSAETTGLNWVYHITLKNVSARTCAHLWDMENVFSSFAINIKEPTAKNGCQADQSGDTVQMSFEFNALEASVNASDLFDPSKGCRTDPECGGGGVLLSRYLC